MFVPDSVTLAVGITNTTPANNILAADATINRWFRGVYATNTTGLGITITCGIGAAAILSASNSDVASGTTVPANASSFPVAQWAGRGRKALGAGSLNAIFAIASGAGLLLTVVYDKSLPT